MKRKHIFLIGALIVSSVVLFISCKKEKEATTEKINAVQIVPVLGSSATESKTFLYSTTPYKVPLAVGIISPVASNVDLTIAVDNSLVTAYNTAQKTTYATMPAGSYSLEATSLSIPKDSIVSQKTNLVIKANMLTADVSYLLPVKVASVSNSSVSLNAAIATKYYIIRSPTPVIVNLSNGKTSYFDPTVETWRNPQRGNDGNTNGDWGGGSVCESGLTTVADHYWEVDLGAISPRIDTVRIWNRTDCCDDRTSKFHVFISQVPFSGTTVASSLAQAGVYDYYQDAQAGVPTQILPKVSGRYIRLQITSGKSLTLAELTAVGIKP